jgi:anti-anti-sigma factor
MALNRIDDIRTTGAQRSADRRDRTAPCDALEEFGVTVLVATSETVLRLHGEVDCLSSPYLRGVLDASIDAGHCDVVLDLTALEFMDAAGLRVIANAADRLELMGGTLAIRSPSELVRRMLEISGMTDLAMPYPCEADRAS